MSDHEFPTASHERFAPMIGTFAAEVKLWMGAADPHVMTGIMTNTMELNNQFLHQVYEGDPSEASQPGFQGRGYLGFNTATNKFEGFWIDIASTIMMTETGDVDASGKLWTMTGEFNNPKTGEPMKKKSVITVLDDHHHRMEQFMDGPDGEIKTMEINYTRQEFCGSE